MKCFKIDFGRFVEHHANYYSPDGEFLPLGRRLMNPIRIMWRTCPTIFQK